MENLRPRGQWWRMEEFQTICSDKELQSQKEDILYTGKKERNSATVAQLVEQLICNQPVGGSSPLGGSTLSETYVILLV